MRLNTQKLIDTLSGKNKTFIKRVAKHQEEKYGNKDIFVATINYFNVNTWVERTAITMFFGENWIEFNFNTKGELVNTYGMGQGHKYHKSLQSCAEELFRKVSKYENY